MKKLTSLFLGLVVFALAATLSLSAQTIGGDTSLNSKSWTWLAVDDTAGIPETALWTAPATPAASDFMITAYLSVDPIGDNGACPEPILTFTDEFGVQQDYVVQQATAVGSAAAGFNYAGTNFGNGLPSIAAGVTAIHVAANTSVYVKVFETGFCQDGAYGFYNFALTKTKLNP